MNQQVFLEQSKPVNCESCGNDTFTEILYMRSVSRLITGQEKDAFIPIGAFACFNCGHINKEFKPVILTDNQEEGNTNVILQ